MMRPKMKKLAGGFAFIFLVLIVAVVFRVHDQIGQRYSHEENIRKFGRLSYYDAKLNEFVSPQSIISAKDKTTGGDPGFLRFFTKSPYAPQDELPKISLSKSDFSKTPLDLALYWFGHSTALMELDGYRMLIDPVFDNAGPLPGITKRFAAAPVKREDLPAIDVLLITHDHYDHLEANTIKYFAAMDTRFVVPLGVGARLKGWGVPPNRITELAWHQSFNFKSIKITATPGVHYSGRSNKDKNKTLWASYVISGEKSNLFWSGDTGYSEHFKQIGDKYGPFDIAFVEIDAWNKGWPNTHLFPEQVIQVVSDVKARSLFPIHLATFDLALHPWKESIALVANLAERADVNIITPVMGQKTIPGVTKTGRWWVSQR
jgi:L-ascorbate metabolism protein UlaG (beta-lactamase superfamily)